MTYEKCLALLSVYGALLSVYGALLSVHEALWGVCIAQKAPPRNVQTACVYIELNALCRAQIHNESKI